MKIDWSFWKLAASSFVAAGLLTYYPISEFATPDVTRSIIGGSIMSVANLVLGYLAIEWSYEKSHTTFLKIVLGGIVVRLMIMWGVLLVLLKFYGFHSASLMLTLLFLYVLNLVLEIFLLQKKVTLKGQLNGT